MTTERSRKKKFQMRIGDFFNRILPGELWVMSRSVYYAIRHRFNAARLPANGRYFVLEEKTDKMSAEVAIRAMKEHFQMLESALSKKSVIKVGFCVYSSSEWQCEKVYRFFENDDRFKPSIILCGLDTGNRELTKKTYLETCRWFEEKGTYDLDYCGCKKTHASAAYKLDSYDILFYFQPSSNYLPEAVNFLYRTQTQLMAFVLYGYKIIGLKDLHVKRNLMGVDLLQMFWVHFCTNEPERSIRQNMRLKGYNAVVSGLPKIDDLIDASFAARSNIWKETKGTKLKIIWAPHFNMEENMNGTFHENYEWFYEFAKRHLEYSWIVKPHPRMMKGALEKGVFDSPQEYKEYFAKWDRLPNASVVASGDYYEIFRTSDAMITDSMSFRAEYFHTLKPLLVLLPPVPRPIVGEADKLESEGCYRARGNDFRQIEKFIVADIQCDCLRKSREKVYHEVLDIKSKIGMSSSRYIYEWIVRHIFYCE